MTNEARPLDASSMPDVSRLVREVNRTGRPRLLQVDGETARLSPARRPRAQTPAQAEFEAGLAAAFGAWKGLVDPEAFKRQRRELEIHDRNPRSL
jgi:hypothetical protein